MAKLFDRVGQSTATTGTGTITLGAVITDSTNGDLATFTDMGAAAGDSVNYLIVDGNNWEIGTGALGGTGPGFTLTRTVASSKIAGTVGTTALTLSGTAKVYSVPSNVIDNIFNQKFSSAGFHATDTEVLTGWTSQANYIGNNVSGRWVLFSGYGGGHVAYFDKNTNFGFSNAANNCQTGDTIIGRDAAGTLALRNSTNAQTFKVYGSTDQTAGPPTTNYSRLSLSHAGGTSGATIATEAGGTGTAGPLTLGAVTCRLTPDAGTTLGYLSTWVKSAATFVGTLDMTTGSQNINDFVSASLTLAVRWGTGNSYDSRVSLNASTMDVVNTFAFRWSTNASNAIGNGYDTGLARNAAGVVEINNGTAGTFRDLIARNVRTNATTVASLTAAATAGAGARSFVTDATAPTFGATVTGGGAVATPVYSDGTNWKVG